MTSNECRAAGIIIFKKSSDKPQVLGLIARENFRKKGNGVYDIPKGRIDPGETPFECAKRECLEETCLKPQKFIAGPYRKNALWVWLAELDEDPVIGINPISGYQEHLGYDWLTCDVMSEQCLDYLTPFIVWAKNILLQE